MANRVETAVDSLTTGIMSGRLRPGHRLRETEQSASLGVSRNTFREAIRVLSARGLVRRSPHRGAVVATLSAADVGDLYRLRRLLEVSALDRARDRPADAFHHLGAAIGALSRAIAERDEAATIEADVGFHRAIVDLHESPRLSAAFAGSMIELRLALAMLNARAPILAGLLHEHRSIYASLIAGEIGECSRLLNKHLVESERAVLRALPR